VYSERIKSNKSDHMLPLGDNHIKMVKSSNDSGSKIRVIDNFETKTEHPNQQTDGLIRSAIVPPLSDLSRRKYLISPPS
jgi:hypothetical protein